MENELLRSFSQPTSTFAYCFELYFYWFAWQHSEQKAKLLGLERWTAFWSGDRRSMPSSGLDFSLVRFF